MLGLNLNPDSKKGYWGIEQVPKSIKKKLLIMMISTLMVPCEENPMVTSGCNVELWWFLYCYPAPPVDQTVELLENWDAMILLQHHCNVFIKFGVSVIFLCHDHVIVKVSGWDWIIILKLSSDSFTISLQLLSECVSSIIGQSAINWFYIKHGNSKKLLGTDQTLN